MTSRQEGNKNGRTDFRLGLRLESVWLSTKSFNHYAREYAIGYRTGWLAAQKEQELQ
jgi:hypothetical protein